jgi:hypothetical protein
MQTELKTLIKNATTLVQLVTLYLFITWTYSGIHFIVEMII